jgi:hypothetical protein
MDSATSLRVFNLTCKLYLVYFKTFWSYVHNLSATHLDGRLPPDDPQETSHDQLAHGMPGYVPGEGFAGVGTYLDRESSPPLAHGDDGSLPRQTPERPIGNTRPRVTFDDRGPPPDHLCSRCNGTGRLSYLR